MTGLNDDDDDALAPTSQKRRLVHPEDEALIGTRLGEYRVDSIIGEGGMGIVFKGEQLLIKKQVAIKVLRRTLASESRFASRLLDEARAANAIHHPAIIDAHGFGQTPDGRPYLVMDFVQGEPLDARLSTKGRQSVLETLKVVHAILAPLEAAHASGVIHRDLKPSNVFLQKLPDGTDFPRLLDFGLALNVDSEGKSGIVGTPAYMAPEQAKDTVVTTAVDLYALGCLMYELLTGRPPFEGATVWAVLEQHHSATPKPLSSLRLDLDDELSDFVSELLAKDPSKRPTATQARRESARMIRARSEATTVSEGRAKKVEEPALNGASSSSLKTTPFQPPQSADPQDAPTVIEVDHRPRKPRTTGSRKAVARAEPKPAEPPKRTFWIWPVVIVAAAGLLTALVMILKA